MQVTAEPDVPTFEYTWQWMYMACSHIHSRAPVPTEPETDTAEPEGPVLLDSSKTIQHVFHAD